MTNKEIFELVLSYFPQKKHDKRFTEDGNDCFGLPYPTASELTRDVLNNKLKEDVASIENFVNDQWSTKTVDENIDYIIKGEILDLILGEILEGKSDPTKYIHFKGSSLMKVNEYVRKDDRFAKLLFTEE